jgi:hypothetical protein
MSKHNRRDGYWKYYHQAHTLEKDVVVRNIVALVKENPPPGVTKKSNRGKKPVHSWEKMACICILMVIFNLAYRKMQNEVPCLNLPWNEPYPDHSEDTWIARSFKRIPLQYLENMLQKTALICIRESGWKEGLLATDSTGVETDIYDEKVRPVKKERKFEKVRIRRFLKWHIVSCHTRPSGNTCLLHDKQQDT